MLSVELGRGTSTYDGMAIAGAVLHHLATHTLPLAFFAVSKPCQHTFPSTAFSLDSVRTNQYADHDTRSRRITDRSPTITPITQISETCT